MAAMAASSRSLLAETLDMELGKGVFNSGR
jgi:hypothetical protein